jgi:hypothetical protein
LFKPEKLTYNNNDTSLIRYGISYGRYNWYGTMVVF